MDNTCILKIENLHKSFGDNEVLKGINLTVNKGDVVAIIGPSGCGKTTMGRTILRLYDVTSGEIWFKGKEVSQISD